MDASQLIRSLRARNFHLRVEEGKLYVSPFSNLTEQDKADIRAQRNTLVLLLSGLTDAQIDAIAVRAEVDPPDFGEGNTCLRETVLVDVWGQWWAFSPDTIKGLDEMARIARERKTKEQGKGQSKGKRMQDKQ